MNIYTVKNVIDYISSKSLSKSIDYHHIRIENDKIYIEKPLIFNKIILEEFTLPIFDISGIFSIVYSHINGKFIFPQHVKKLDISDTNFSNTVLNISKMHSQSNGFNTISKTNLTKIIMPAFTPCDNNFYIPAFALRDNTNLSSIVFQHNNTSNAIVEFKGVTAFTKFDDIEFDSLHSLYMSDLQSSITNFKNCDKFGNVDNLYLNISGFESFEGIKNLKILDDLIINEVPNYKHILELFQMSTPHISLSSHNVIGQVIITQFNEIFRTIQYYKRKDYIMDAAVILIENNFTGDELIV